MSIRQVSVPLAGLAVPVGGEGPGRRSSGQGKGHGVRELRSAGAARGFLPARMGLHPMRILRHG